MKNTLITFLSIIFIFALFADVNAQMRKDRKERSPRLHEELNLTAEQESKLDDLRNEHQKQMIDLRAELDKARLENQTLRRSDELNRSDILDQTNKMNSIKNKMAEMRTNHFMDVYSNLNDEQRKIWKDQKQDRPDRRDFDKRGKIEREPKGKKPCNRNRF